tara:strand:+ start:427 stop:696 length:270 start_codon:yes stop_codon:yes gene_type:complete
MGRIVALVCSAGEFVGEVKNMDGDFVVLRNPRMIIHGEEGLGFARGVCVSGKENPDSVEFFKSGLIYMTDANESMEKAFIEATSSIILR